MIGVHWGLGSMARFDLTAAAAALALTGAAFLALPVSSANATEWISQLDYKNSAPNTKVASFGYVDIVDGLAGGTQVKVSVYLDPGYSLFLDTGNGGTQQPFSFNLLDSPDSTVTIAAVTDSRISYDPVGSYHQDAFGYFTNSLACLSCNGSHGVPPPLVFTVTNTAGITFAGQNFRLDANNVLLPPTAQNPVTGNRFQSNSGGYLFAADIYQTGPGCGTACTFVVAARSVSENVVNAVPEPSTWALMILGFGGIGAVARHNRKLRLA